MVRKHVSIESRQDAMLKRWAQARGVSEAEIIRRAIDSQVASGDILPPDAQAWSEARAFMQSLAQRESAGRPSIAWSRA